MEKNGIECTTAFKVNRASKRRTRKTERKQYYVEFCIYNRLSYKFVRFYSLFSYISEILFFDYRPVSPYGFSGAYSSKVHSANGAL